MKEQNELSFSAEDIRVEEYGEIEPWQRVDRKFVFSHDGEGYVLTTSGSGEEVKSGERSVKHVELFHHRNDITSSWLFGGGFIERFYGSDIYKLKWNSESCSDAYGFDRPHDRETADKVLSEIRKKIILWDKEMGYHI